jgi:hypothetical protein
VADGLRLSTWKHRLLNRINHHRLKNNIRRQLTLFVSKADAVTIEAIRGRYNPLQQQLIAAHVTLCREDEIVNIDTVLHNLENLNQKTITVFFDEPIRFDKGAGLLIPAAANNEAFQQLRKKILAGVIDDPRKHQPHITLMHPRNSVCTDEIFEAIKKVSLSKQLSFNAISLIEQRDRGRWETLKTFTLPAK